MTFYQLPAGAYPHDVAPAPDGTVWYSGAAAGFAGRFDPKTGKLEQIALGPGAAPHGVIVGPDGAAWLTEGGQNAIARVDPKTKEVKLFPLPKEFRNANLNTLVLRWQRHALVHRPERRLWPGRSASRQSRRLGVAEGPRHLRHHHDAARRHLVRLARGRSYCPRRYRHRRSHCRRAAAQGRRPAPHLVGLQGHVVGELLAWRRDRSLRSCGQDLDDLSHAEEQVRHLLGLCRRQGSGLGHRLDGQRHPALRSQDRDPTRASRATRRARTCARCSAGRARRGAESRARTGWW